MSIFKRVAGLVGFAAFLFTLQSASVAQDTVQHEMKLDETIKAACHSYMIDALPDALSWLKDQVFENSPFCKRIEAAYDQEDISDTLQEQYKRKSALEPSLDRSKKNDRTLTITIECQSEYMCLESRIRFKDTAHAVSQAAYDKVAAYCEGRYGCIQAFFDEWPRDIPKQQAQVSKKGLSFESVLKSSLTPKGAPKAIDTQAAIPDASPQVSTSAVSLPIGNKPTTANLKLNHAIKDQCFCSLGAGECFDNPYGPIKKRLAQIEEQRRGVCMTWQAQYADVVQSSTVDNDKMDEDLVYMQKYVSDADERGYDLIRLAKEDFQRIKYRVRNNLPFKNTFEEKRADKLASGPSANVGEAPDGFGTESSNMKTAIVADAQNKKTSAFLFHPERMTFSAAKAFCQSKGMHLPSVAEAKPHLKEMIPLGDPFWGIWTTDQTAPDKIVGRYRTLRNNGFTEGENPTFASRVFCFS